MLDLRKKKSKRKERNLTKSSVFFFFFFVFGFIELKRGVCLVMFSWEPNAIVSKKLILCVSINLLEFLFMIMAMRMYLTKEKDLGFRF